MNDENDAPTVVRSRSVGAGRSPNYPQMNIVQAIDRVKKVYAEEHTHSVPDQSIAAALGYSSLNGTSKVVLSSLKKFGLLVSSGDGFRVSQDAMAIIELPLDDPTRIVALHKSGLRPPVFKQIYEKYGTDLPSDASLRHYLVGLGFESDAANQVIRFYKETMSFLSNQGAIKDENLEIEKEAEAPKQATSSAPGNTSATALRREPSVLEPNPASSASQFRFQVALDSFAEVTFTGEITQQAIRKLMSYLELTMDVYPSQPQNRPGQVKHKPQDDEEYPDDDYTEE